MFLQRKYNCILKLSFWKEGALTLPVEAPSMPKNLSKLVLNIQNKYVIQWTSHSRDFFIDIFIHMKQIKGHLPEPASSAVYHLFIKMAGAPWIIRVPMAQVLKNKSSCQPSGGFAPCAHKCRQDPLVLAYKCSLKWLPQSGAWLDLMCPHVMRER